jgi:hypothetical protein
MGVIVPSPFAVGEYNSDLSSSLREADCILDQADHFPYHPEDSLRLCDNSFGLPRYCLRHKDRSLKPFEWNLNRLEWSLRPVEWSLRLFDCWLKPIAWSPNRSDWSRSCSDNGICRFGYSLCQNSFFITKKIVS